jgi:nucleoside-diphosphate-sugar epimerase
MDDAINLFNFSESIGSPKFIMSGTISERLLESNEIKSNLNITFYVLYKFFSKLVLKKLSKKTQTKFVWAQLSNLYGLNDNSENILPYTIHKMEKNEEAHFSLADQFYDFLNVRDAAKALRLLSEKHLIEDEYYIGSGSPKILREYINIIQKSFNREGLIKFGTRKDDGYRYFFDWFNIENLVRDTSYQTEFNFEDDMNLIAAKSKIGEK